MKAIVVIALLMAAILVRQSADEQPKVMQVTKVSSDHKAPSLKPPAVAESLSQTALSNPMEAVTGSQLPYSKGRRLEEPLTERIRSITQAAEYLDEQDDLELEQAGIHGGRGRDSGKSFSFNESFADWESGSWENPGDGPNIGELRETLFASDTDLETKQDALANIEALIDDDNDLIRFLRQVIEDGTQPDDLRVQALSRLADFGMEYVRRYGNSENEELLSELDLLERIELSRLQNKEEEDSKL